MELIERYAQFWEYTISGGVHRKPWCAPELVHTKIGGEHQKEWCTPSQESAEGDCGYAPHAVAGGIGYI